MTNVASLLIDRPGESPPPPPPPPPVSGLVINVGTSARQTIRSYGAGLGSPGGQSAAADVAKCLDAVPGLITELRINTPSLTYLASVKEGLKRGVKYVHVTGYEGPGSGPALAKSVAGLIAKGIPVTSCSLMNEPDFKTWTDAQTTSGHKALREGLNALGLTKVDVVGPEFASNDGQTLRCARLLTPLMPGVVQAFGHHSYGLMVNGKLYDALILGHGPIRQYECGYLSFQRMATHIINDLNYGCETWIAHRLHNTVATSDPGQNLFDHACKPYVWVSAMHLVADILSVGTIMRRCDDFPQSPVYAACGRRADGRWALVCYANSGKQTPTFDIPELRGRDSTWTGTLVTSAGKSSPISCKMDNGLAHVPTLNAGELIGLVG